jgi:hypothetical protein
VTEKSTGQDPPRLPHHHPARAARRHRPTRQRSLKLTPTRCSKRGEETRPLNPPKSTAGSHRSGCNERCTSGNTGIGRPSAWFGSLIARLRSCGVGVVR